MVETIQHVTRTATNERTGEREGFTEEKQYFYETQVDWMVHKSHFCASCGYEVVTLYAWRNADEHVTYCQACVVCSP